MSLFWLLPLAVIMHIIEEFVFPGGFTAWYCFYKEYVSSSLTPAYLIMVNVLWVTFCSLPLVLDTSKAIVIWLSMASIVFVEAIFHIRGTIALRTCSPGAITSIVLYLPLALYGYWHFLSQHQTSKAQALVSGATGMLYWWFSSFSHKRREKNMATRTTAKVE